METSMCISPLQNHHKVFETFVFVEIDFLNQLLLHPWLYEGAVFLSLDHFHVIDLQVIRTTCQLYLLLPAKSHPNATRTDKPLQPAIPFN